MSMVGPFTEPSGKWDEAGITMSATANSGSYTLNGTKSFVLDGHTANLIIVVSITGIVYHYHPDAAIGNQCG
mgnify:CR=1 FL=1